MRLIVLVTVLAFVSILAKSSCERKCLEETDEEICESFGLQCGVTVHIEDGCGVPKDVDCNCPGEMSCSLETLKCE